MADLKISELNPLPSGMSIDEMEIPIDNGQNTYSITVENFNARGTTSAQNYAAAAATSASNALSYKNAAAASEANALSYKNSAVSAKTSAESAASDALSYKNAAESAKNDAVAAKNTVNTAAATVSADVALAEAAAETATSAKELAQTAATSAAEDKALAYNYQEDAEAWAKGTRDGSSVGSTDPAYHNNSKYYAEEAASSASSAASDAQTCATSVVKGPYIGQNGHWYVWSWETQAYVDTNINATGPTGNGIASVAKTGTSGKVDTYTITFTNGTTFNYTVTNGEDGQGSGDMLMTDYDRTQDVYNAGGIPAYVASAITGKMNTDGSNAANTVLLQSNLITGNISDCEWNEVSITKAAGEGEDVIIVETYSDSDPNRVRRKRGQFEVFYKSHIADENLYYLSGTDRVYVVIDSVSGSYTYEPDTTIPIAVTITVTAHLKVDDPSAISLSSTVLNYNNYINSDTKNNVINASGGSIKGHGGRNSGRYSQINGDFSAIDGQDNAIDGECSYVNGRDNYVGSSNTVAEGYLNYASGSYSHIEGRENYLQNSYCHVSGYKNNSKYEAQAIFGKYNSNKLGTLLEIGNGTAENTRSNAFEVYKTGYISQNNGIDKYMFAKLNGLDGFYDGSGNFHPLVNLYLEQSVTLSTSADTTVTFTNAGILATSRIDAYTSDYTIVPSNVVASAGSCTVTFKKASTASTITVGIEVKN